MRRRTFACLAGVLLTGCMSSGVKVEHAELERFQAGITPCQEMVDAIAQKGKQPTSDRRSSKGLRQITYTYTHHDADVGAIALAVIGIPAGRTSSEQTSVVIDCDEKGLFTEYVTTTGQMGTGFGVTGGAKQ